MRARTLGFSFACALALGASALGCAKTSSNTTAAQLTPEQAALFEQGVDFIGKIEGLAGRWREDWDRDLQTRVQNSDLIAVVTVRAVRTDTDPEKRVTHRLVTHVDRVLLGSAPGDELELLAREDAAGYASIDQSVSRLPEQQFVAFVKWYEANEQREARFHLSPGSEDVLTQTEAQVSLIKPQDQQSERVIIHTN